MAETGGSYLQQRPTPSYYGYGYPPPYNYPLAVQAYQDQQYQNALINQALVKYNFGRY